MLLLLLLLLFCYQHLKKIELKLNKRQQELVQADSIANADGTKEKELQESLNELSAEAKLAAKKKSEQEEEYRTVYGPVKTHERTLMSLKREIGVAKRKLKSAAKHLQDIRDDIKRKAGSAESEEAKRTERMEKAEQDLATTKENHHHIATGIASSLKKYEELEPREDSAVAATAAARRQLGGISKKVQELKASEGSNSLAVFGSKCVAMDQKVSAKALKGFNKEKSSLYRQITSIVYPCLFIDIFRLKEQDNNANSVV